MTRKCLVGLPALSAVLVLAGCGSKGPENTPEAVAQAFADAMAAGKTKVAAKLCDYVAEARRAQPDWDEIPSGQRGQIIATLQKGKAGELESQTSMFAAGMKAGTASTSGASATVELEGGRQGAVAVYLAQSDGKWGVVAFAPAGG